MLSLGALDLRSKTNIYLDGVGCPIFKWAQWHLAWKIPTILNYKARYQCFFKKVPENKSN